MSQPIKIDVAGQLNLKSMANQNQLSVLRNGSRIFRNHVTCFEIMSQGFLGIRKI